MLTRIHNWLNGWRLDFDGWWVRARRENDPDISNSQYGLDDMGFLNETSIAVRTPELARKIDRWPYGETS